MGRAPVGPCGLFIHRGESFAVLVPRIRSQPVLLDAAGKFFERERNCGLALRPPPVQTTGPAWSGPDQARLSSRRLRNLIEEDPGQACSPTACSDTSIRDGGKLRALIVHQLDLIPLNFIMFRLLHADRLRPSDTNWFVIFRHRTRCARVTLVCVI